MGLRNLSSTLVLVLFFVAGTALSQGTAVSLKAGTIGIGIDVTKSISPQFNGRIGASFFKYNQTGQTVAENPVDYDLDIKMNVFSLLFDYYPFRSGFRLSAGMMYNNFDVTGSGMAAKNYLFDGITYTPEDIGELTVTTEASLKFAPYLGMGFGNPVAGNKKLGFVIEVGALYIGPPDVSLTAEKDSMIFPTTDQEEEAEDYIKDLKWYPVLNVGLSYKF